MLIGRVRAVWGLVRLVAWAVGVLLMWCVVMLLLAAVFQLVFGEGWADRLE